MITDEQIAQAYEEQYAQGFLKKEVRSYEVSLWTLQDDFITVLKWSDVENKGRIQNPQMILSDDGTQSFTFSIPMYLYTDGKLEENPLWYNTQNGNIMINLRKIKVIFNKGNTDKEVFEFLITKVVESHEADKLMCDITCEGFAFNELGKIGYNYNLSLAEYELDRQRWEEAGANPATEVKQNIQYWCEEKLKLEPFPANENDIDSRKWYYEIQMNWSSFERSFNRQNNIVYEEAFISSWSDDEGTLTVTPDTIENAREKQRTVEAKESNVYNITQEIAKAFGVFCRYDYGHDLNNHITYRKIVFFNNFIHEKDIIDITYPYASKKVSREIDSTNITTKLYVNKMDDSSTLLGEANISYCPANRSGENYILNFDYLKETGNLTEDQQQAIKDFEDQMHFINKALTPLENKISIYQIQETELKAKQTVYTTSIEKDKEEKDRNSALSEQLLATYGDNGSILSQYMANYNENNPDTTVILKDDNGVYYINLANKQKGIKTDSVRIYREYSSSNTSFSDEITDFSFEMDEYGNPKKIYGIAPNGTSNIVYMTYWYAPHLYYDKVVRSWEEKLATDTENLTQVTADLAIVTAALSAANREKEEKIIDKEKLIAKFELQMGAALREGYWQPENYQSYGEHLSDQKSLTASYSALPTTINNSFDVGWDINLFDEEQKSYYESSVNQTHIYYPCINLSSIYDSIKNTLKDPNCAFIFNNNYYNNKALLDKISNIECFSIGSKAIFSFIKSGNNIYPALVLVGAKSMTDEQITFMKNSNQGHPRIGIINSTVSNGNVTTTIGNTVSITSGYWINGAYDIVYPRIRFSSLMLKTDSTNLYIYFNSNKLEEFEDYYIRNRNGEAANDYNPEYLITIKPMYFIEHGGAYTGTIKIDYVLSNASTSIYLDALKISKENAYPKVSYTVDPNILNKSMIRTLYKKLGWLILINDFQLKLKEAFGYISKLNLNLDFPDKDTIEVKNYTTKFEDLFSSIVAQTEQMQRSAGLMASLAGGKCTFSNDGIDDMLSKYNSSFEGFFEKMFKENLTIQDYLASLFEEAGAILSDSNYALSQVRSLNSENFNILNGFTKRIQTEMVPTVFRQINKPTVFKTGDIWIEIKNDGDEAARYIATMDSSSSSGGHGWVKTYNGSLAQIEGAAMNVDTASGKVDILAQNQININSGNAVNIAADGTVNITGNDAVNIGGTTINIGSYTVGNSTKTGGINLVSTAYNTNDFASANQSKVIIKPNMISLGGSTIELYSGNSVSGTSALRLDGANGIYIGSTNKVVLYSGDNYSGANVELNPDNIIFGVSNLTSASDAAVKINGTQVLLAVGTTVNTNSTTQITTTTKTSGVQIQKDYIGLATGTADNNNARSLIAIKPTGIVIGSSTGSNITENSFGTDNNQKGSYIKLSGNGLEIGSSGYFKINAESGKFKVISNASNSNPSLYIADNATWANATSGIQYIPGTGTGTGLSIKGDITATSFKLGLDGHNLSSSDISDFDTAVNNAVDTSGFSMDGLSYITNWANTNKNYVSLTSTGGLLIGANNGIIIPSSANSAASPYLLIDENGIELNGKHIKINGEQEWSRDDIIVLKKTAPADKPWLNSLEHTQNYMMGTPVTIGGVTYTRSAAAHDWVLIKPYYDATLTYSLAYLSAGTSSQVYGESQGSFGNGATWYRYTVRLEARAAGSTTSTGASLTVHLNTEDNFGQDSNAVTLSISNVNIYDNGWATGLEGTTGQITKNLCQDSGKIYIKVTTTASAGDPQCQNIYLICECDGTTSRVPCTVYYYP